VCKAIPARCIFCSTPTPPCRLPHGANVNLTWDAEPGKWLGTLTIPPAHSGIFKESVVSADDGALFALLQRLDRKFRGVEEEAIPDLTGATL
jgi:hypothetical protein